MTRVQAHHNICLEMTTPAYALSFKNGNIDETFIRNRLTCVVAAYNATACYEKRGFTSLVNNTFPYADIYRNRRPLYSLNRCMKEDRPVPGNIIIRQPPRNVYPYVACLVTQYAPGRELECNSINQKYLETSRDVNFIEGLKEDLYHSRVRWFKSAMRSLSEWIAVQPDVATLVFPDQLAGAGIPCSLWNKDYLPVLKEIAGELKHHRITCILLEKWWVECNVDEGIVPSCSIQPSPPPPESDHGTPPTRTTTPTGPPASSSPSSPVPDILYMEEDGLVSPFVPSLSMSPIIPPVSPDSHKRARTDKQEETIRNGCRYIKPVKV